jgi:hypothetical protein
MAIVVFDCLGFHTGKIVQVLAGARRANHWLTEPELRDPNGALVEAADSSLRPIRDPGEDAQDETLLWKQVPQPEKESA